jgi:hypothetical protein
MAVANKFRSGQIVWATVRDRNGFRKSRPVIILTPDEEIKINQPLVVMAITTTFQSPRHTTALNYHGILIDVEHRPAWHAEVQRSLRGSILFMQMKLQM